MKLVLRLAVPLRFWCTYLLVGLAVGGMVAIAAVRPRRLVDLHYAFLPAARAVAAGHSPYVGAYSRLHAIGSAYIYPPPVAFATVPLTLMPERAAAVLFVILSTAAVLASLWLLGVRTPAYFAAALVANCVWASEFAGTLSVFVLLAVAVAWRWRDRWVVVGAVVAAAVAAKIFCWPLVVWLVATRRFRAAALAMGASVAAVVGSWAAIGFAGLHGFPALLRWTTADEAHQSYSLVADLLPLGTPLGVASLGAVALAVGLVVLAAVRSNDEVAFLAGVAAMLVASPIVWAHYFVLLIVPCAFASRRSGWVWHALLVPWSVLALAFSPWFALARQNTHGNLMALLAYQLIAVVLFGEAVKMESRGGEGLQSSPPRFNSDPRLEHSGETPEDLRISLSAAHRLKKWSSAPCSLCRFAL